jgi:hypothetical protein
VSQVQILSSRPMIPWSVPGLWGSALISASGTYTPHPATWRGAYEIPATWRTSQQMIGLAVSLNGKKLTVAGTEDLSVLNAIVRPIDQANTGAPNPLQGKCKRSTRKTQALRCAKSSLICAQNCASQKLIYFERRTHI